MPRTFTAQDLIALPPLNAEEATALATELATATKGEKLAPHVVEALADLQAAAGALIAELQKRGQTIGADPKAARAADAAIDRAWGAFAAWLGAWAELDGDPHAEPARAAYARLFPDGLAFVNKRFKEEWAESEARLTTISAEKIDATIATLGGKPFLKALTRAHAAYGEALGITKAKPESASAPLVRDARAATLDAMREYVALVAASVRRKKPETEQLATRLLRPIAEWESSRRAPPAQPAAPPPVAAPTPAPAE